MRKAILGPRILGAALMWLILVGGGFAQTNGTNATSSYGELGVITRRIAPFVIKDGDNYKGFSQVLRFARAF